MQLSIIDKAHLNGFTAAGYHSLDNTPRPPRGVFPRWTLPLEVDLPNLPTQLPNGRSFPYTPVHEVRCCLVEARHPGALVSFPGPKWSLRQVGDGAEVAK